MIEQEQHCGPPQHASGFVQLIPLALDLHQLLHLAHLGEQPRQTGLV